MSKNYRMTWKVLATAGVLEGAAARLEWDRMPHNALLCKACGEQREDFCAASGAKVTAFLKTVKTVQKDFLTA